MYNSGGLGGKGTGAGRRSSAGFKESLKVFEDVSVRAQPCEVVEVSTKSSKMCEVFKGLVRDALRFLTEEIQS